jgi:predicted transcriptional regulator of viral defense system
MERYDLVALTKNIYNAKLNLFTLQTLRDTLEIKKDSTLFSIVRKLINSGLLLKIEKDKYLLKDAAVSDYSLANFIYQPSYISFETALNLCGILSQFPYEISSATTKKTQRKTFQDKIFSYIHIKKDLFWGYEKKGNFLIAIPEKALLDQLYLSAKGYKSINLDEYNWGRIRIERLRQYIRNYSCKTRQFSSAIDKLKEYIRI